MKNKMVLLDKSKKGISLFWYPPPNRMKVYIKICEKYKVDWKKDDGWLFEDTDGKFFEFIQELKDNDIIVMNAN